MSNVLVSEDGEKKSQDKSLIGHVVEELGGVVFALEAIDKVLGFASKAFIQNKFYQGSIKTLRGMTPVVITGHKIYTSVKGYRDQKKQMYARQKKSLIMLRLMKMEHIDEYELDYYEFNLGKEIIGWLLNQPKTESFKIVDFYNSQFEIISSKNFDNGLLYILIEFENNKFMVEADVATFNNQVIVSSCKVHTVAKVEKCWELKNKIFGEFIKYFDTSKNIIEMTSKGLQTRPRMNFEYNVYQFDVNAFKHEIENTVDKGKKRGYILIGPPGVGKSTVLIKLEKELPNIPIVYISPSSNVYREDVSNTFNFLRSISPCIAIWEDLDGYSLASKQDRIFGEFLEQMDSLKHKECIVIIATLNEPEAVHGSLINRRGRFDKVFYVDYPKSNEEIISVLKNSYNKETGKDLPFDKLSDETLKKIVDNSFSHSDICEIILNLFINNLEMNQENIGKSVDEIVNTMKAIGKCSSEKISYTLTLNAPEEAD